MAEIGSAGFSQTSIRDLWSRLRTIETDVVHCQYRWRNASTQTEREQVYRDCYDRMAEAKGIRDEIEDRQEQTPTLEFVERDQRGISLGKKTQEGDAEGDCSIRAISTLTGADYNVVAQECTTARNELLGDTERVEDDGIPFLALQKVLSKYKIEPGLHVPAPIGDSGNASLPSPAHGVLSPEQAHYIYGDAILAVGEYDPYDETESGPVEESHVTAVVGGKIYDTGDLRKSHRVVEVYQPTSETPAAVEESRKRWVSSQEDLDATARQLAETVVEARQAETGTAARADADAGTSNTLKRIGLWDRQKLHCGATASPGKCNLPQPRREKRSRAETVGSGQEICGMQKKDNGREKPKRRANSEVEYRKQKRSKPTGGRGGRGTREMMEARRR